MEMPQSEIDLTGMLLIAMPGMGDPRFETSVVYICAHSPEGAMGLIVNKPATEIAFDDLLEQLKIARGDGGHGLGVHFGGPVEHGRGFVLHSGDYNSDESTMRINDDFSMTATRDILADIAGGGGPEQRILMLGYAGWGPGQIEDEISQNGWLSCAADPNVVFGRADAGKWEAALRSMGVEPIMLSGDAGHA
ncbi:MAG: YqgE/AlgH family protein [Paracoccaceae bacterium]